MTAKGIRRVRLSAVLGLGLSLPILGCPKRDSAQNAGGSDGKKAGDAKAAPADGKDESGAKAGSRPPVTVAIDAKGTVLLEGKPFQAEAFREAVRKGQPKSSDGGILDTHVAIQADPETKWADVFFVVWECQEAGVWRISFGEVKADLPIAGEPHPPRLERRISLSNAGGKIEVIPGAAHQSGIEEVAEFMERPDDIFNPAPPSKLKPTPPPPPKPAPIPDLPAFKAMLSDLAKEAAQTKPESRRHSQESKSCSPSIVLDPKDDVPFRAVRDLVAACNEANVNVQFAVPERIRRGKAP